MLYSCKHIERPLIIPVREPEVNRNSPSLWLIIAGGGQAVNRKVKGIVGTICG